MKRPWAFICAVSTTKSETLRRYCRKLYELGYVPVCPPLQDGQYLVLADPTERADYNEIVREKILRSPLLVFCGRRTDATTAAQIGLAQNRDRSGWPARSGGTGRSAPLLRPHRLGNNLLAGFASIAFGYPNAHLGDTPNPVCHLAAI